MQERLFFDFLNSLFGSDDRTEGENLEIMLNPFFFQLIHTSFEKKIN
jgi:hypothetical protein